MAALSAIVNYMKVNIGGKDYWIPLVQ